MESQGPLRIYLAEISWTSSSSAAHGNEKGQPQEKGIVSAPFLPLLCDHFPWQLYHISYISSIVDTKNNGMMQGANVLWMALHKINYIIFRTQCKMKLWGP